MDRLTVEKRSRLMARVRSKNTGPEIAIRKLVFSMRYRYRLHDSRLPGKPDLVFAGKSKAIFVHGCFWHRHARCRHATTPGSATGYWVPKFARTIKRDQEHMRALREMGWSVLVVWECEIQRHEGVARRIQRFLAESRNRASKSGRARVQRTLSKRKSG